MTLTITHTHSTGTLIEGTSKGDGTGDILKSCGWKWGRSISCWYVPRTRYADPKRHIISHTTERLRAAGYTVSVSIDTRREPLAQVTANRISPKVSRAAQLSQRADHKYGPLAGVTAERNTAGRLPGVGTETADQRVRNGAGKRHDDGRKTWLKAADA